MNLLKSTFAIVLLALITSSCSDTKNTELFNGENLDNWGVFISEDVPQDSVFWVEDGLINVSGIPNAYIRTKAEYENYKLHVEWRWAKEPKNSGILLHITGEDLIWPNCIEAQLKAGKAGDLVLIGKGVGITVRDDIYIIESEENRFAVIDKFLESSENDPGEWNEYDITVDDQVIELKVNGYIQNRGIAATKTKGSIGIQSEGGPMQFRNIYLEEL